MVFIILLWWNNKLCTFLESMLIWLRIIKKTIIIIIMVVMISVMMGKEIIKNMSNFGKNNQCKVLMKVKLWIL